MAIYAKNPHHFADSWAFQGCVLSAHASALVPLQVSVNEFQGASLLGTGVRVDDLSVYLLSSQGPKGIRFARYFFVRSVLS